jgi:hypothetical protein
VRGILLATAAALACLGAGRAALPSVAHAAFTRPFVRQITESSGARVGEAGGLATDAEEHLWIGIASEDIARREEALAEYDSAVAGNGLIGEFPISTVSLPEQLAIERPTSVIYATGENAAGTFGRQLVRFNGAGEPLETWKADVPGHRGYIAVDNSTDAAEDPSACGSAGCVVYLSHVGPPGERGAIEKFSPSGEPIEFGASGLVSYVNGNKITGAGGADFGFEEPEGLAVDSHGDIFAAVREASSVGPAVAEYAPSGVLLRLITPAETPGAGESGAGAWGGLLTSIAFDPASGHLLVGLEERHDGVVIGGAVDEFDVATGRYINQITESGQRESERAPLSNVNNLATDTRGDLYVADSLAGVVDVYGPGRFLPSVRLEAPENGSSTGITLRGAVNPEKLSLAACRFEYVDTSTFAESGFTNAKTAPCVPGATSIPVDSSFHQVQAAIGGLLPGSTYRYRLVATTEGSLGGEGASAVAAFTAVHAPAVSAGSTEDVTSTFVQLGAVIDPLGAPTSYHFEVDTSPYTDESQHGRAVPTPDQPLGAGGATGSSEEHASQQVGGLAPGTTYFFRAVATNEAGTKFGAEGSFTTLAQQPPDLPDGRKYELVTPALKGGSDMFGLAMSDGANGEYNNNDDGIVSESGSEFLLQTHASFGSFPGNEQSGYVFKRSGTSWEFASLASPGLGVQIVAPAVFDPRDLSTVGINDGVGSVASEAGTTDTVLLGAPGGPYATLHADPSSHDTGRQPTLLVGGSQSLSQVVLQSPDNTLCPGAAANKHGETLCEWSQGTTALVNVDDEGALLSPCGARLGAGAPGGQQHGAVSADGSRLFFTAPDPKAEDEGVGCWNGATTNAPQLYLRTHGHTLKVSAPEPGVVDPTGQHYAEFAGASEDGSRVFFLTESWLTKDHPSAHGRELYECRVVEEEEVPACQLRRISAGQEGSPGGSEGAFVAAVPAISKEGDVVYYEAYGDLAPGGTTLTERDQTRDVPVNVYRFDATTGTTTFVTTVTGFDYPLQSLECEVGRGNGTNALCPAADWYTTPDGRYLLFGTTRELTGYHTAGPCQEIPATGGAKNGHCVELYRYDSGSGELICVSCNPTGAGPVSNAQFTRSQLDLSAAGPPRGMSNDGSYVFFDTADALVPTDGNRTLDVYEWHEGSLALLSSGQDSGPSFFLGASPTGGDVYIGTHAKLVRQDTDQAGDIYDARVCTAAEPCIPPPQGESAQCEGDACQVSPAPPNEVNPVSAVFSGIGNLVQPLVMPAKPAAVLTKAQKLEKALRACRKKPKGRRRKTCEATARRQYASAKQKRAGRSRRKAPRRRPSGHAAGGRRAGA